MSDFGSLQGTKEKLHVTINNLNAEIDGYLLEGNGYIKDKIILVVGSAIPTDPTDDQRKRLDDLSEQFAAAKFYYYNNPTHPTDGLNTVKAEIKDFIEAHFSKRTEGFTKSTFLKTTNKITSDTPGIRTSK